MHQHEKPSLGPAHLKAEVIHHSLLLVITLTYCIAVMAYLESRGLLELPIFTDYLIATAIPVVGIIGFRVFGETAFHALHVRPFLWSGLWQGVRQSEIFSAERAAAAVIPIMLLPLFASVFTSFKVAIPQIDPFSWDPILMHYDQVLHGGVHPWEWLQPVLGHPLITSAVSYLYNIWHGMWLVVYWQCFRIKDRELRMQFLLAFVLAWISLGSFAALMLSSAGPCYYGDVVGGANPYADLMAYLHQTHEVYKTWSIIGQEYLWDLYQNDQSNLGGGISAMPSLHVTVALLMFFLARRFGSRMAWISGIYVLIMMVGSVHLGWHYAIDGYVGLVGGTLAWLAAGWLVRHVVAKAPESEPELVAYPATS